MLRHQTAHPLLAGMENAAATLAIILTVSQKVKERYNAAQNFHS